MMIKEGRILCITAVNDDLIVVGTKQGHLIVFDAGAHEKLHSFGPFPDSVLCLKHLHSNGVDILVAGLANGQLAVIQRKKLRDAGK